MEFRAISLNDVWNQALELLQANQNAVLGGIAALSVLNFTSSLVSGTSFLVAGFFVQVMIQAGVTAQLLDIRDVSKVLARARCLFSASLASGILIFPGLLLFVVPGLILLSRWFVVTPLLIRDELTVGDALRMSWAATRPSQGAFLTLGAIYLTLLAALLGGGIAITKWSGLNPQSLYLSVPSTIILSTVVVVGWVAAVAALNAVQLSSTGLKRVFG
ncbi:MAG TPA: hypothetical protein VGE05_08765 [Novosphingobium sp.]